MRHPSALQDALSPLPSFLPPSLFLTSLLALPCRIIRGLLASELPAAAEALVRNLLRLVDAHGFVPNGARSYYTNRSQPPLLASMVLEVWRAQQAQEQTQEQAHAQQAARAGGGGGGESGAQGDGLQLLREALPRLEKQHAYWTQGPRCGGVWWGTLRSSSSGLQAPWAGGRGLQCAQILRLSPAMRLHARAGCIRESAAPSYLLLACRVWHVHEWCCMCACAGRWCCRMLLGGCTASAGV
jgi:hypothetical protein